MRRNFSSQNSGFQFLYSKIETQREGSNDLNYFERITSVLQSFEVKKFSFAVDGRSEIFNFEALYE